MKLCFDSIEEVREFIKSLKGQRGAKDRDDDAALNAGPVTGGTAPAPMMPPQGNAPQFNPGQQAQPQFQPQGGFPGVPQADPLVARIVAKIDSAVSGGQPVDAVLNWFRGQCGAEAANATLDQIKQVFLPKLAQPTLENIAKLMNA